MVLFQQRGWSMTWFTLVKLMVRKEKSQIQQNLLEYSQKIIKHHTCLYLIVHYISCNWGSYIWFNHTSSRFTCQLLYLYHLRLRCTALYVVLFGIAVRPSFAPPSRQSAWRFPHKGLMTWSLRLETSEISWRTLRQTTIAMENPPLSVVFNQERRQIFHGYARSIWGYFGNFARTFGRSDSMIRGGWFWWHGKKADRDIFKSVKSSSFFLKSWKKGETNNFQGPRFAIFLVWHQKHKSAVMTCTGQLWMCWHLFE